MMSTETSQKEYLKDLKMAKNVLCISKDENNSNEVAITYGIDSVERNEAISANNKADDLKGLQKTADHFLKNCYMAGMRKDFLFICYDICCAADFL